MHLFTLKKAKKDSKTKRSSDFSYFFREASSREKKKVFMDVAKKATKDQVKILKSL